MFIPTNLLIQKQLDLIKKIGLDLDASMGYKREFTIGEFITDQFQRQLRKIEQKGKRSLVFIRLEPPFNQRKERCDLMFQYLYEPHLKYLEFQFFSAKRNGVTVGVNIEPQQPFPKLLAMLDIIQHAQLKLSHPEPDIGKKSLRL